MTQERTHWRDQALSERHRTWGVDLPAVDVDFLLVEYNHSEPVALIEYKRDNAPPVCPEHPTYLALQKLGTRAGLPVFVVRYLRDFSRFHIEPLNDTARRMMPDGMVCSECEYVDFLRQVRSA